MIIPAGETAMTPSTDRAAATGVVRETAAATATATANAMATANNASASAAAVAAPALRVAAAPIDVMVFWDYDTQWGADRSRCGDGTRPAAWGHLEFPNTDELLDLHARFDIPACFAIVGAAALPGERPYHDPAQIRRVHAAGHEIASHALRHEWLPALDRRALQRTLRESKDALEQCIGAPVTSFVPPFNQPFDYARGWSFSLAERREAGARRTTLRVLCETLRETGYQFCRVAYSPLSERMRDWVGRSLSPTAPAAAPAHATGPEPGPRAGARAGAGAGGDAAPAAAMAFRPGPPVVIAGITCVRVGPCGFDLDRVSALRERAGADADARIRARSALLPFRITRASGLPVSEQFARRRQAPPIALALYGHPHSLHGDDASQSVTALRRTLAAIAHWTGQGAARCVTPRDLPCPR
jgi:hypothetical protein